MGIQNFTALRSITVTPTAETGVLAPGDIFVDSTLIQGACAAENQTAYFTGATFYEKADQTAFDMKLVILKASTSMGSLNSAPNISDANGTDILAVIDVPSTDWFDVGGFKMVHVDPARLPIPVMPVTDTPNLYFALLVGTSGTPTLGSASAIVCRFWFQDMIPTV